MIGYSFDVPAAGETKQECFDNYRQAIQYVKDHGVKWCWRAKPEYELTINPISKLHVIRSRVMMFDERGGYFKHEFKMPDSWPVTLGDV